MSGSQYGSRCRFVRLFLTTFSVNSLQLLYFAVVLHSPPTLSTSLLTQSSHRILGLPCLVLSCLVLSCLVLSCLVLSCLVLSCLVLSCLVLSCLVLSCLVLSCLVLSCLVLSCLVLSCLVYWPTLLVESNGQGWVRMLLGF